MLPPCAPATALTPLWLTVLSALVALVVVWLSVRPVANVLSPGQVMNTSFDPLHLVNTYGAFGSVTMTRQLVIEGTTAAEPDEDDWVPYQTKGQPVRTDGRPPQWAPYHLRLDWQLWFAAMEPRFGPRQRWLFALLDALLEGDAATESLLRTVPVDDPPRQLRVLRYRYRYTTPAERAETGEWWRRERLGTYVEPVTPEALRARGAGRQPRRF